MLFPRWLYALVTGIILMMAGLPVEARTFIGRNGSTMEAKLVSHKGGKVKIQRDDGKEFEIDPAIFSEKDEAYIRKWMSNRPETISYSFTIEADKKKVDGERRDFGYKIVKNDLWSYVITITNDSQDAVSDLTIKYRVFFSNMADGTTSAYTDESPTRMVEGEERLKEELKFNRDLIITTEPVRIDLVDYGGTRSRYKDELKGCLVRILDPQGEVLVDWSSAAVWMNDKTWENTSRRFSDGPKVRRSIIR